MEEEEEEGGEKEVNRLPAYIFKTDSATLMTQLFQHQRITQQCTTFQTTHPTMRNYTRI